MVTSQHPFNLRTEKRRGAKEHQFIQIVQEMLIEDEKILLFIAQGLSWTTDEPEHQHRIASMTLAPARATMIITVPTVGGWGTEGSHNAGMDEHLCECLHEWMPMDSVMH